MKSTPTLRVDRSDPHFADQLMDLMTSPQVCRAAGITYRMLDYWARHHMIEPVVAADGAGSVRLFDPAVVDQILEMKGRIAACPYKHKH